MPCLWPSAANGVSLSVKIHFSLPYLSNYTTHKWNADKTIQRCRRTSIFQDNQSGNVEQWHWLRTLAWKIDKMWPFASKNIGSHFCRNNISKWSKIFKKWLVKGYQNKIFNKIITFNISVNTLMYSLNFQTFIVFFLLQI